MTDGINLKFIDDFFPVPGQDNDSQGFRDNFKSIVDNFQSLNTELADLQKNAARTDSTTDYNGSTLKDVNLLNSTFVSYDNGNVDSDLKINFSNGQFQTVTVTSDINIVLDDWPIDKRYSFIRIALKSDGNPRTVFWAETGNQTIKYDASWPNAILVDSASDYVVVEFFSFDGGQEIFASYKGPFQEDKVLTNFFDNIEISDSALVKGDLEVEGALIYDNLKLAEGTELVIDADTAINGNLSVDSIITPSITAESATIDLSGDLNVGGDILVDGQVVVRTSKNNSLGLGDAALENLVSGTENYSLGDNSLTNVTTGSQNISLGYNSSSTLTTGSNNIVIGSNTVTSSPNSENEITLGSTDIQRMRIPGLEIDITASGALKTPAGTNSQRPTGVIGSIRFNTDRNIFEGYNGSNWVGLGSVADEDQDTYISTESSVGIDEDTFMFYTGGQLSAKLDSQTLELQPNNVFKITSGVPVVGLQTGSVQIEGGVSIDGDLLVGGEIINDATSREDSVSTTGTTEQDTQTKEIVFTQDIDKFNINDSIRIFNASSDNQPLTTLGLSLTVVPIGFTEPSDSDTTVDFSYKIAQFDLDTGKISPAIQEKTVTIIADEIISFNNVNNIQLTLTRQNSDTGLLIYRKVGSQIDYRLITVLGSKDFGNSTANLPWTDYYDYDYTDWSKKDFTNAFTEDSGLVHFPLNPPSVSNYGWIDTQITGIETGTNTITVDDSFFSSGIVNVYKDDTQSLQSLIDLNSSLNINSVELESRTYYISQLILPENFSIIGQGEQTRIVKLPWSSRSSNSNLIINVDNTSNNYQSYTVANLSINGNAQNQYLEADEAFDYLNYCVRLFGDNIRVDGVEIENVIAGGIYLYNTDVNTRDVTVTRNKIANGSLTYRYLYKPLLASESSDIHITQNQFSNFPQYVDVNALTKGVVTNNIISNCGSGIFGFGVINTILNPNVLVGPGGEYLQSPDILNSEYDAVNIVLEPDVDYVSPSLIYQESGELFDLTANQAEIEGKINELRKINGVEVLSTDYSETTGGVSYISFDQSANYDQGELQFRIQESLVNDLLSRANYETLYQNNENTEGLVYRILVTEYPPQTNITGGGNDLGSNVYRVPVEDASFLSTNDIVRLVNHSTTPTLAGVDGRVVNINTITNQVDIKYDFTVTDSGLGGAVTLKNTFVVVKGKIN